MKKALHTRLVPLLSLFAAFSFVIMMFNLPLPGGTTGHAVGIGLATVERFAASPHVKILEADARSFDYARLRDPLPDPARRVLVVGNLPYSVAKPILMALVDAGRAINEMALMLQKEVAERIAAGPGSKVYGSLSVLTQIACEVHPRRQPRLSRR